VPKLLTVNEAAEFLQVSRATIYNLINQKNLPFVKIGRSTRFSESALLNWIEEQNKK
jgi:excisionase family DNA binding protein